MYIFVNVKLFLSEFNETWIFSTVFKKIPNFPIFMKILPVGAELFHADRRSDMAKLIVAFRNFANTLENAINNLG